MVLSRDERQVEPPIERRTANTDEGRTDSNRIDEGGDGSAEGTVDSMLPSWSRIQVDRRVGDRQRREHCLSTGQAEYCLASIVAVAAAERQLLQRCWMARETAGAVVRESGG